MGNNFYLLTKRLIYYSGNMVQPLRHSLMHIFPSLGHRTRSLFLPVIIILLATLVIDTSLNKVSDVIGKQSYRVWSIPVFLVIAACFIVGQYFLLGFIKLRTLELGVSRGGGSLKAIHVMVSAGQYLLTAVILFLIYQILATSQYNTATLTAAATVSYTLACIVLGLLALRFFLWWTSNNRRSSVTLLLYAISSVALVLSAVFSLLFMDFLLTDRPQIVRSQSQNEFEPFLFQAGSIFNTIHKGYIISSILSFVATWVASLFLLRHYSERLGRTKFWILILLPLMYFLSQFVTASINFLGPVIRIDPVFFTITFTLVFVFTKLAGGILFGVAFWTVAKTMRKGSAMRDYMKISAFGVLLFFIAGQAALIQASYPPFGIATVSIIGLASYMMFVGIYSSALSLAHDVQLRKLIRTSAESQYMLLKGIAIAEITQELQSRVLKVAKEQADRMKEESGVEPAIREDDMKNYLNEVLIELERARKRSHY
jgi:hypothetical protein